LPDQPPLEASAEQIETGETIYGDACKGCHGANGVARFGGSVPDLRYADAETHATWHAIVIGGSRSANGMPAMEMSVEESEAIRSYILELSEAIRSNR
jgi:mono/diheme cytochrome c family protein